jgi:hypothetical protein
VFTLKGSEPAILFASGELSKIEMPPDDALFELSSANVIAWPRLPKPIIENFIMKLL